jgi:hypothetical protein
LMSSASASDANDVIRTAIVILWGFICADSVFLLSTPQDKMI